MDDVRATVAVIVVAAGSGSRLGADVPKAFVEVAGRTILEHSIYSVLGMSERAQVIVVAPATRVDQARALCARATGEVSDTTVVAGGANRQASVASGLAVLEPAISIVLVHDAARALTPSAQFDRVVAAVRQSGHGAIPGLAVSDTIKRVASDSTVRDTVDRSELSAVQTPQGFPREQVDAAYAAATDPQTDDAALLAAVGHPVTVIDGDPRAFKITTPWDLRRAEQVLVPQQPAAVASRVGIGTDTHAFDRAGELWLAGLSWPGEPALAGHSDGDAVAHAITDALLSAAGLGDIGTTFGTDDPRFDGAHGDVFLRETRRRVEAAGFRIGNVSVQLIGNRPRFSPRRAEAQAVLTAALGAPVSVSATTTDALGFTGRGEGVAAIATALLYSVEPPPSQSRLAG